MKTYVKPNETTRKIHHQIIVVCNHLTTDYKGKKHGGYNIYKDDKIDAYVDTYVSNVQLCVLIPNQNSECVFSCAYSGDCVTYHPGKWEIYLNSLCEKATKVKEQKDKEYQAKLQREKELAEARASDKADAVFE